MCDDGEYQEKIYIRKKPNLPNIQKIKEMKEKA